MEKEEKLCKNCGAKLAKKAKFCPECGTKVEDKDNIEENKELKEKQNVKEAKVEEEIDYAKENKKLKTKKFLYPILSCVITFTLCLVAFGLFYNYYLKNLVIETTKREVTITDTGISEAVDKVYDSVVVVESYNRGRLIGTGTGFVYKTDDKHGYILTNQHVIEQADEAKVVFTNKEKEKVEILGSDEFFDTAVLQVDKEDVLSVAEIGSTKNVKLGDTTFAIGAPLDSEAYAWTVTRGIVSGKDRTVEIPKGYFDSTVLNVLQTDTPINNGNSGGPLCNSNGEVIGITNLKLAASAIEGMGFAIPIEDAVRIADVIISGEQIKYPKIGVVIYDMISREGQKLGVKVESVVEDSAADKAGIKKGDIIKEFDGKKIPDTSIFKHELYRHKIGEKVEMKIERDGHEKTVKVSLDSPNPHL